MSPETTTANALAVERMMESRPKLIGIGKARTTIPGFRDNLLLHAGPPISADRMGGPMRGAVIGSILFEGWAKTDSEAWDLVKSGAVEFEPNHHHQAVAPMAGIISPSMSVYVVENATFGNRTYSNINEGFGRALRFGAYGREVIDRLHWMESEFAPLLGEAIERHGNLDMRALFAEALYMGDEGHNRTQALMHIFLREIGPMIAHVGRAGKPVADALAFIGGNSLSVINPLMASCKAMCDAAHGIDASSVVTAMARNGTDFGIRVSGLGDEWYTAPAGTPQGVYFPQFQAADASGDIGDSVITETAGIGHFAAAAAPAVVTYIGGHPDDTLRATNEMYGITVAEHRFYKIPALNFRGTPTGIDILKVVESGNTPLINTGIAHREAGIGQIGAGTVRQPLAPFTSAVAAYTAKYGH